MFDNIFSSSPGVWTGLIAGLVSLPILIHLINMLRHKRVKWAAMEFLLKSHKKHRNWVRLKQFLLLASRICILLLVLFMLGQVGCNDPQLAQLLGGKTTHHYVLLDDSFSMSDASAGVSAMDHARETLSYIAARAKNRENQRFTVMRFSAAERAARSRQLGGNPSAGEPGAKSNAELSLAPIAELNAQIVDSQFDQTIDQLRGRLQVSSFAAGPLAALRLARQLVETRANEKSIVYVLSDYREKDWSDAAAVKQVIEQIDNLGCEIELIKCVKTARPNLAITSLQASGNVRVAGVPLMMTIEVKNFGLTPARKVQVQLTSAAYPTPTINTDPASIEPDTTPLPTLLIQEIAAMSSETRQFPVFFNQPGTHAIKATLQHDSVALDNQCWSAIRFDTAAKVLIIGQPNESDAKFVSLAISPNGMTGIQPVLGTPATLRDAPTEQLDEYESIFLLDVDRLDLPAVRNLNEFAQRGGGIVFFTGPNTNIQFYNDLLFDGGQGIFPLPMDKVIGVAEQLDDPVPDIVPENHPIFSPVLGVENSPLDLVQVTQVIRPAAEWRLEKNQSVNIAATIRGNPQLPLMVEKRLGNGRVIAVLSTARPQWNNWSRNGTFPAILLLMHEYVSSGRNLQTRAHVGTVYDLAYTIEEFRPEITFVSPLAISKRQPDQPWDGRTTWQVTAVPTGSTAPTGLIAEFGSAGETDEPGIYETWLRTHASTVDVARSALNVDTAESNLAMVDRQELLESLAQAHPKLVHWDEFQPATMRNRGSTLAKLLLILLLAMLVAEQILAWSASYHPKLTSSGNQTPVRSRRSQQQAA